MLLFSLCGSHGEQVESLIFIQDKKKENTSTSNPWYKVLLHNEKGNELLYLFKC